MAAMNSIAVSFIVKSILFEFLTLTNEQFPIIFLVNLQLFPCCTAIPIRKCDRTTEFDCGGGMCIINKKVCDGTVDCPGGQDEPKDKCDVNECSKGTHGCDHTCVDTPAGFYCDCHKGYVYFEKLLYNVPTIACIWPFATTN